MTQERQMRRMGGRLRSIETQIDDLTARVDRMAVLCRGCRGTLVAALVVMLSLVVWRAVAQAGP